MNGRTSGSSWFRRARKLVARWGIALSGIIVVVLIVVSEMHLIERPTILLGMFFVLMFFLSEQIEHNNADLSERISSLERLSESTQQIHSLRLLSLMECVEDLGILLKGVNSRNAISIDHIGLDMSQAWEYIRDGLLKEPRFDATNYRALIIADDPSHFQDEEVQRWCIAAGIQKKKIISAFPAIKDKFQVAEKRFNGEIRSYKEMPVVHGLHVTGPIEVYYVAICRWDTMEPDRFDWAGRRYYRIVGLRPNHSIHEDIALIFDGYFNHLWSVGKS